MSHRIFAEARIDRVQFEFQPPYGAGVDYWSTKAVERIVIRAHEDAFPEHVQVQIRQRRLALHDIIKDCMQRAVKSDREMLKLKLRAAGYGELADFVLED